MNRRLIARLLVCATVFAAALPLAADTPEPEIVAHLFKLYVEMTAKELKK